MNESLPPQRHVSRTNLRYGQPCRILRSHQAFYFSTGYEPVNECNTNDEPLSTPAISYPTYDLPDDWMAKEIQKMRAQENEKEKISDDLRNCVDRNGKTDAVSYSAVTMIEEPQPQQEMIQSENGNKICARSDGTEFEETSQEMCT